MYEEFIHCASNNEDNEKRALKSQITSGVWVLWVGVMANEIFLFD